MSDKKLWEQYVALEKERDALRSLVVMRFDHDHPPQFTQGYDTHELTEPVTAEHCRWFVAEIERLSAEVAHIKEVEFPRKAQAVADGWRGKCERLEAKIEAMERQEPAGKFIQHPSNGLWEQDGYGDNPDARPLYALPVTQPAPSEQDASVRKAWARFSHELHRSPDAPYPGMADAFEQHFSQSFIDREWRAEAATWAAAWKAAKRHCVEYASVGEIADAVVDLIVKGEGK